MTKLMRAKFKNRLISEFGIKKLKNLLNQVRPNNFQLFMYRRTINVRNVILDA